MNYRMIIRLLSVSLRIVAAFMLPALLLSLSNGENASAWAFAITIALMFLLSTITCICKPRKTSLYMREGFVVVAVAWIVLSVPGALPFFFSRCIPSFVDCLFETISGFTTTGASILNDVEALPMGMLYWRSFTHWLGGMGVLVFLLAVSTISGNANDALFIMRAESPGPQVSKLVPRTMQTARLLYTIYIGMTILQTVLMLFGGMSLFDAVTTAFGTAGTGGFGIRNDSLASYSPYIQWVVTIFMALFGVNFGIYYLFLMRSFKRAFRDEELRFYFSVILASILIITLNILPQFDGHPEDAIRHAAFQVVSIITTTGFSTANFDLWPQLCRTLLLLLMIIGACASSTGGGMKCSRVLILLKSLRVENDKLLHPHMVKPVRMDGKPVGEDTLHGVYAFLMAYCVISLASVLLISLDELSFETNLSAVLACLNNIGPGLHLVGPMGNYSMFSDGSKLLLSLDMLIGRLEIFPIFMLLMPHIWKRARDYRA
ncbi:MAG: TrkH family potassium uptake protein [Eubacteriales bacterium]|nr:TrkH family potassium uptake protein [Eubacteriales bacterium]